MERPTTGHELVLHEFACGVAELALLAVGKSDLVAPLTVKRKWLRGEATFAELTRATSQAWDSYRLANRDWELARRENPTTARDTVNAIHAAAYATMVGTAEGVAWAAAHLDPLPFWQEHAKRIYNALIQLHKTEETTYA